MEWAVARFCNETRTIPRRFLNLRPIRGFINESPEKFLSNVARYGVTESLLRLRGALARSHRSYQRAGPSVRLAVR